MCKTLSLCVNTLTPDNKYSHVNRENLRQPIEMQLSQKNKAVSQIFFALSKSKLNFDDFQKKDDHHS